MSEELVETQRRLTIIEALVEGYRRVFETIGFPMGEWLSPAKASEVLGIGIDRILDDIALAEAVKLIEGRDGDLVYGKHYRNDGSLVSEKPSWKVNVANFSGVVLNTPPAIRVARMGLTPARVKELVVEYRGRNSHAEEPPLNSPVKRGRKPKAV